MIHALILREGHDHDSKNSYFHALNKWKMCEESIFWARVEGTEKSDIDEVSKEFSFDALAISDSMRERHPPKYESFTNFDFVLLRSIQYENEFQNMSFVPISLFVGENYLVTRSANHNASIDYVWKEALTKSDGREIDVWNLVYQITRKIVDEYFVVIREIETRLEFIEDQLDEDQSDKFLPELTRHNSLLRKIARNLKYTERVVRSCLDKVTSLNKSDISHEMQDALEHAERSYSLANMYQALCGDLINAHLSFTSHRVNKVVKTLTIVTVLFLPLSFIAGLYGMNFKYMPELDFKHGYFYILGTMIIIEIALILLLKKLKWF